MRPSWGNSQHIRLPRADVAVQSWPYEFGVKASIVTNNRRAPGGLFVLHAKSLPDNASASGEGVDRW
jgi:hypothetical protein